MIRDYNNNFTCSGLLLSASDLHEKPILSSEAATKGHPDDTLSSNRKDVIFSAWGEICRVHLGEATDRPEASSFAKGTEIIFLPVSLVIFPTQLQAGVNIEDTVLRTWPLFYGKIFRGYSHCWPLAPGGPELLTGDSASCVLQYGWFLMSRVTSCTAHVQPVGGKKRLRAQCKPLAPCSGVLRTNIKAICFYRRLETARQVNICAWVKL